MATKAKFVHLGNISSSIRQLIFGKRNLSIYIHLGASPILHTVLILQNTNSSSEHHQNLDRRSLVIGPCKLNEEVSSFKKKILSQDL
jgi:hypothetical protein